jgi:hypothetical protein
MRGFVSACPGETWSDSEVVLAFSLVVSCVVLRAFRRLVQEISYESTEVQAHGTDELTLCVREGLALFFRSFDVFVLLRQALLET